MNDSPQDIPGITVVIRVEEGDFSPAEEYAALRARLGGRMGAVASFVGLVRDHAGEAAVSTLHLEHYPGMTERSIGVIVDQAVTRWPLLDVVVIHRVGALQAAEQIVFVQVAAGHRATAFAACEFIMDYLKTEAVFWKREAGTAGARWVEATGEDRERVRFWGADSAGGAPPRG
jgi:molybdopterin synthase catalytic subunit